MHVRSEKEDLGGGAWMKQSNSDESGGDGKRKYLDAGLIALIVTVFAVVTILYI